MTHPPPFLPSSGSPPSLFPFVVYGHIRDQFRTTEGGRWGFVRGGWWNDEMLAEVVTCLT